MTKIIEVGSSYETKNVSVNDSRTLRDVLEDAGQSLSQGVIVTISGRRIRETEYDKTLAQLNVNDGDIITANAKAKGNNI